MCALDTHTYMVWNHFLFNQVGCQNLTRVSASPFRFGVSCSCSFLREDVQSKINIWSESSLSHMQLALYRKDSADHMLSYMQGCRVKICFMANDILLSQLPVCILSCTPNTGLPGFTGRQTKTCKETETRVVIWSHLMAREGKGRGVFSYRRLVLAVIPVFEDCTETSNLCSTFLLRW